MSVIKYFADAILLRAVPSSLLEKMMSKSPDKNSKNPWAMSPNMTPKRNGKVIVVKTAGLNSLYQGIPYVFTIY